MPEINPLTIDQIFEKKIAENTGSDYDVGDISEINPLTPDQILLKEIALNTAGGVGGGSCQYQEEEHEVGSWFGFPLFEKTLSLTTPNSATETTIYEDDDEISILYIEGFIEYGTGSSLQRVPLNISTGGTNVVWTIVAGATNKLLQKVAISSYQSCGQYITIRYLKPVEEEP